MLNIYFYIILYNFNSILIKTLLCQLLYITKIKIRILVFIDLSYLKQSFIHLQNTEGVFKAIIMPIVEEFDFLKKKF